MKEIKDSVIHHVSEASKKAGRNFDADCFAEMNADFDAAERRIVRLENLAHGTERKVNDQEPPTSRLAQLERQVQDLATQVDHLNRHLMDATRG
jgi:hypothetical protein